MSEFRDLFASSQVFMHQSLVVVKTLQEPRRRPDRGAPTCRCLFDKAARSPSSLPLVRGEASLETLICFTPKLASYGETKSYLNHHDRVDLIQGIFGKISRVYVQLLAFSCIMIGANSFTITFMFTTTRPGVGEGVYFNVSGVVTFRDWT